MLDDPNNLTDRVSDIEKTIGDIDHVLEALKDCLASAPLPTCPPYCGHGLEKEYVDDRSLAVQVTEMAKWMADLASVFEGLKKVLAARSQPTCPPYCGHEINGSFEKRGS